MCVVVVVCIPARARARACVCVCAPPPSGIWEGLVRAIVSLKATLILVELQENVSEFKFTLKFWSL